MLFDLQNHHFKTLPPGRSVLGKSQLLFLPDFLERDAADKLYDELMLMSDFVQETFRYGAESHLESRETCWFGFRFTAESAYSEVVPARDFPPLLDSLREEVELGLGSKFNCALVTLYRSSEDYIEWHSDCEAALGPAPVIASVSLGAVRSFLLRSKMYQSDTIYGAVLTHGSLCVMSGAMQDEYEHCIPPDSGSTGRRINITFRNVRNPPERQPGKAPV